MSSTRGTSATGASATGAGVTGQDEDEEDDDQPRPYTELADWFHLLTAPADYAEDAQLYLDLLTYAGGAPPRSLLELGSGGGNNASPYKRAVQATLVDRSPRLLSLSQRLNPGCEHRQGDVRSVRLGRTFDAVLVQDAVLYLTTEDDLRQAVATAFLHCRPGGVEAGFRPDVRPFEHSELPAGAVTVFVARRPGGQVESAAAPIRASL